MIETRKAQNLDDFGSRSRKDLKEGKDLKLKRNDASIKETGSDIDKSAVSRQ